MKYWLLVIMLVSLSTSMPALTAFAGPGDGDIGFETPSAFDLPNPLGTTKTIDQLIKKIVSFLQTIAIPILAIMVIWGAFQMLFATGDPENFKKGQKTILYSVIGFAIILIANGIAAIVERLLK